jgi:hypothetical protein
LSSSRAYGVFDPLLWRLVRLRGLLPDRPHPVVPDIARIDRFPH